MSLKKLINDNKWDKIYNKIIKKKINPYNELSNGNTIVHLAGINNNEKIIDYFLKNDINALQKSNDEGNTPIHLLALYGYIDLLKKCIKSYPSLLNLLNNNDENIPILLYNDINFIKWIIKFNKFGLFVDDLNGENLITKNIYDSKKINDTNYKILKILFANNDINNINNNNDSLLCYAIKENKSYIAKLLINNSYDVNKKDLNYVTPFLYAIRSQNYDLATQLIKNGADINYTGAEGDYNPMIWAIKNEDTKLIQLLLENKYDVNKYNRYIETSLHYILYKNDYNKNVTPTIISKMLYHGDLNIKNVNGQTPLHLLCKYHNWKNYSSIIKHKKMDIFIEDNLKKRPFDYLNGNHIYDFINVVMDSYTQLLDSNISNIDQCRTNIKSTICKNELKKYIFKTKRSIPVVEDNMIMNKKINIITGVPVTVGVFNSDSLHNMIYTVQIMKKYKNVSIPFQYYISDKVINDKILYANNNLYKQPHEFVISDLVKIYTEYFYEILPYLIIWRSQTQYFIHNNLKFLLKKCLSSQKIRFIVLKLTLVTAPNGTHANIIIYDKQTNILERFEPYGIIPYLENSQLNVFIENIGKNYINKNLTYRSPKDIFGDIGFQTISNDSNQMVRNIGDPAGFCLSWTLWYLEMKINNPDVHPNILIKNVMKNITDNTDNTNNTTSGEKLFISFIRNYASNLDKQKNEFMKLAGIKNQNVYNLTLDNDDQNKVQKLLVLELNKIIMERY